MFIIRANTSRWRLYLFVLVVTALVLVWLESKMEEEAIHKRTIAQMSIANNSSSNSSDLQNTTSLNISDHPPVLQTIEYLRQEWEKAKEENEALKWQVHQLKIQSERLQQLLESIGGDIREVKRNQLEQVELLRKSGVQLQQEPIDSTGPGNGRDERVIDFMKEIQEKHSDPKKANLGFNFGSLLEPPTQEEDASPKQPQESENV